MIRALGLRAPAKVNLALQVVGRRPDGYHQLRTLFHAIDLEDQLIAARGGGGGVELTVVDAAGRGLPVAAGDDNLVVRAARAVMGRAGVDVPLRFHLTKRIPAGGGLGGGSSDAAAALRLTDRLLGGPLRSDELAAIAVGLGADVPFFLVGDTCVAGGVGERLFPVADPPRLHLVLVLPPFGTPTAEVFEMLAAELIEPADAATVQLIEPPTPTEIATMCELGNDLEEPALRCTPELRLVREAIRSVGVDDLRMSGSGSTLFVARDTEDAADEVAGQVTAALADLPGVGDQGPISIGRSSIVRSSSAGALPEIEAVAWPRGGG